MSSPAPPAPTSSPTAVASGQAAVSFGDLERALSEQQKLINEKNQLIQSLEQIILSLESRIHELLATTERLQLDLQFLQQADNTPKEVLDALERAHASALLSLNEATAELNKARKRRFSSKSEKNRRFQQPKPERSPEEVAEANAQAIQKRIESRRKNAETEHLQREDFFVEAPEEICGVDGCQERLKPWPDSQAESSSVWRYVPGYFIVQHFLRQKCSCPHHSQRISRAPAPARPLEGKSKFSAEALAHMVCNKFWLHLPLNRQIKMLRRAGIAPSPPSMVRYVQDIAEHLRPIWLVLLERLRSAELVLADETFLKCLDKRPRPESGAEPSTEHDLNQVEDRRREIAIDRERPPAQRLFPLEPGKPVQGLSYLWVFIDPETDRTIFYFSVRRSGETPCLVLGRSTGFLLTDAYSGYNEVSRPGGRGRAGCHVHNRRYYWELSIDCPERKIILGIYEKLYQVENEAYAAKIEGSPAHLELRTTRSAPLMKELRTELEKMRPLPSSKLHVAKTYTLNQWEALSLFLTNPKIPLDNNDSERTLCTIATGRNNWRHVGNIWSGESLAVYMTIISECERVGLDPETYIAHMLMVPAAELRSNAALYEPEVWKPPEGMQPGDGIPLYGPEIIVRPVVTKPPDTDLH